MSPTRDDRTASYLARIRATYPDLPIISAELRVSDGQFNDVLILNEALIVRFLRGPQAAATLAHEVVTLQRLQGRLPLAVPNPTRTATDPATGMLSWMGYARIPGKPLWNADLATINDMHVIDRIAGQLAGFLRALHQLPPAEMALELPVLDEVVFWRDLFDFSFR